MPITINEGNGEQFLFVHIWGKLVKADYERVLRQFEDRWQHPGKMRVLLDMVGLEGRDAGALWDEIKFDLANDFERVATVGDSKWEHAMATLIEPFTKAKTRYFDATRYAAARDWLSEEFESGRGEDRVT